MSRSGRWRRVVAGMAGLLVFAVTAGCTGDSSGPSGGEPSSGSPGPAPVRFTVGVYGTEAELAAHEAVLERFNETSTMARGTLQTWRDRSEFVEFMHSDPDALPDLFLVDRRDLGWLLDRRLTRPVGDLLDQRDVPFGDGYNRDAILAMSEDNALQCMPYGYSPTVMYYNTDLINLEALAERRDDFSTTPDRMAWGFGDFNIAARVAARRPANRGVYFPPDLEGMMSFLMSGGDVFDSVTEPTTLTLSDDNTREALRAVLEVLRNPQITLSEEDLAEMSPEEWFASGRLGLLAGHRDLVPMFREATGLNFDVLASPVVGRSANVAETTAFCMSADVNDTALAGDLLVYLNQADSVAEVASAGALVPVNNEVALAEDFLELGQQPEHSRFFTRGMRTSVQVPILSNWGELDRAIEPMLDELLTVPVLDEESLLTLTERIDQASMPVLAEDLPSESATP